MARTVTVYAVSYHDTQMRIYYHSTKRSAKAALKRLLETEDDLSPEIEEHEIELSRAGVARALQDLIEMTCYNEG